MDIEKAQSTLAHGDEIIITISSNSVYYHYTNGLSCWDDLYGVAARIVSIKELFKSILNSIANKSYTYVE